MAAIVISDDIGTTKLTTEGGFQLRLDKRIITELSHTVDRYTTLNQIKLGDITELSLSPYVRRDDRLQL